jgi:hypothetical protein
MQPSTSIEHRLDLLEQELENHRLLITTQQLQIKKLNEALATGKQHLAINSSTSPFSQGQIPSELQRELSSQKIIIEQQQQQIKSLSEI